VGARAPMKATIMRLKSAEITLRPVREAAARTAATAAQRAYAPACEKKFLSKPGHCAGSKAAVPRDCGRKGDCNDERNY
jgi:hypothetical protein